jgi:competence protein CoiA
MASINGFSIAIEVQLSALSEEMIAHRTAVYAEKGIYVLWLAQWSPYLDSQQYRPEIWERWAHATYFGRVYYWTKGLSIIPYHFAPHYLRRQVYRTRGKEARRGTVVYKSKRFRSPIRGKTLDLVRDFAAVTRPAWENGDLRIPAAKLFMDKQKDLFENN